MRFKRRVIGNDTTHRNLDGSKVFLEFISKVTFRATVDLRKHLNIDESIFRSSAPTAHKKSKDVYLYRVLDEVQKAGVSIQVWRGYLSERARGEKAEGQLERVLFESIIDDQSFRTRKLVETLIDLICFSTTTDEDYFRDFFLLREVNEYVRAQQDRKEFFACESQNNAFGIEESKKEIQKLERDGLDPKKRWYLKTKGVLKEDWLKRGVCFSSYRHRYKIVVKNCLPSELAVLGKSYVYAYGMSKDVHFSADDTSSDFHPNEAWRGMSRAGMLCMAIIIRCQIELNVVPDGINKQLRDLHDSNTISKNLVDDLKTNKAAVGDFVFARGDLAEVMEVKTSSYGYRCYRVKYLNRPPVSSIPEDWFAGFQIKLFMPRKRAESLLYRMTSGTDAFPEAVRTPINSPLPKEQGTALREVVKIAWQARRKVATATKPPQGLFSKWVKQAIRVLQSATRRRNRLR